MADANSHGRFDIAAALRELARGGSGAGQPEPLFEAFDRLCAERLSHLLFTILAWAPERNDVQRLYSSRPAEYPLLGRKAMGPTAWGELVLKRGESWIGRNAADIRWAFPDHQLIARLGCDACINAPVRWDGRVLGVVSVLGPEGAYDEADLRGLETIAPLLVPGFLASPT